ncbi:unnamed protein product, partial [Ectocarpus sp. 6 AP-2014]
MDENVSSRNCGSSRNRRLLLLLLLAFCSGTRMGKRVRQRHDCCCCSISRHSYSLTGGTCLVRSSLSAGGWGRVERVRKRTAVQVQVLDFFFRLRATSARERAKPRAPTITNDKFRMLWN